MEDESPKLSVSSLVTTLGAIFTHIVVEFQAMVAKDLKQEIVLFLCILELINLLLYVKTLLLFSIGPTSPVLGTSNASPSSYTDIKPSLSNSTVQERETLASSAYHNVKQKVLDLMLWLDWFLHGSYSLNSIKVQVSTVSLALSMGYHGFTEVLT